MHVDLTGILLAGGESRRMGRDKGLIVYHGKAFADHILSAMEPLVKKSMIIANNKGYASFQQPVYQDEVPGMGPLGGMVTALAHSTTRGNLILGCDTPLVTTSLLKRIAEGGRNHQACIPLVHGKPEPLVAYYDKSSLGIMKQLLNEKKLKLSEVVLALKCNFLKITEEEEYIFKANINTQHDLRQLL